jgi:hypothetical protein
MLAKLRYIYVSHVYLGFDGMVVLTFESRPWGVLGERSELVLDGVRFGNRVGGSKDNCRKRRQRRSFGRALLQRACF